MAHDTIVGTIKISKLAKERRMPCVPAIEVSTVYNHILGYGVQEWPYRRDCLDPDFAIERLREQDCAVFLSHPYSDPHHAGLWVPEIVKRLDIDGIEWTNATGYYHNKKTHKTYALFPKGRRIAGSDAHTFSVYGSAFTQVNVNSEDPDDLVAAMKKGKNKAYSYSTPPHKALSMIFKSVPWNYVIRRRFIEGRWVVPKGDRPGSLVPNKIHTSKEWLQKLARQPEIKRNKLWICGHL